MVVLVTGKNEEESITNQRADNSVVSGRIWPKIQKQLCMSLLPARKNKLQSKLKALEGGGGEHSISPTIKVKSMQRSGTEAIRTKR